MSIDLMRETIKEILKNPTRSGIIFVRKIDNVWKVLTLSRFGVFDIPKGHMEEGETDLEACLREASEEASITDVRFFLGDRKMQVKDLIVRIATTNDSGELRPNPVTGIWEHHTIKWVSFDELEKKLPRYMKPIASWAKKEVEDVDIQS